MTYLSENEEKTRRFVALVGAHDRRLFGFILSLVPNFADAEELAQQVRLRLWQQFDEYDPEKDFGAWSRTIAHYFVLAHRKTVGSQRTRFSPEAIDTIVKTSNFNEEQDSDQKWAMQECLGKLDESKRQLLMRYYATGETLQEIAREIGRTFDSVRHSVLRTRLALANCIERVMRRERY